MAAAKVGLAIGIYLARRLVILAGWHVPVACFGNRWGTHLGRVLADYGPNLAGPCCLAPATRRSGKRRVLAREPPPWTGRYRALQVSYLCCLQQGGGAAECAKTIRLYTCQHTPGNVVSR
jgi:hypothetical protein